MARTITTSLSLASLTFACTLALACSDAGDPTRHEPARPAPTTASTSTTTPTPSATPALTATPAAGTALEREPAPVELAIAAPLPSEQPLLTSTTTPVVREPAPASASARTRAAMLPAGTPDANAAAFISLPLSKRDKAPVAGIGASGIHLDELVVGQGWLDSRCEQPRTLFDANAAGERVNVCFRVVHPKLDERVSVEWSLAGKLRTTTSVGVTASHAYLTRAWLPVGPSRAGAWTATVKSEDGVVLGEVAFEITK